MQESKGEKLQRFVSVPGTTVSYPETVITGTQPGKTVTVSAGVHRIAYVTLS